MKTNYSVLLLLLTSLMLGAGYGPLVSAATITVNNLNDSGPGSLREAITDAAPGDTINFGVTGTITLTSGKLYINKTLTIDGPGMSALTISGNNTTQVFDIYGFDDNIYVAISDLTITDGNEINFGGGGIRNLSGTVELTNINIFNCESAQAGGGIANIFGTMSINSGNISNNRSTGIVSSNASTMSITNSTISGNDGGRGGGIWIEGGGSASVASSTFSNNTAGLGGGIANSGTLAITNSTISGNEAYDIPTLSTVGGGISNHGEIILINSTITNNVAEEDGDGFYNRGAATLANTIIANNPTGSDCFNSFGSLISLGYSLDSDGTCNLTQPTDLPNTDPRLGPLADNGGPTETHILLEGSPAIDAGGMNCTDSNGNPLLEDQRGELRPVDGNNDGLAACDIGAYEAQQVITIVEIDIKPASDPNSINPRSNGVIPLAILTDDTFDALQADPTTVRFGPDEANIAHAQGHGEDVDNDGDADLVLHFRTRETGIACGDTAVTLTGETYEGQAITGTDAIKTVGCKKK